MVHHKKKEVIAAYLKQQEITIICYIYISIISKFYHRILITQPQYGLSKRLTSCFESWLYFFNKLLIESTVPSRVSLHLHSRLAGY